MWFFVTVKKRKTYIDFANEYNRKVKCIWIDTNLENSIEQIKKRKTEGGHYVPKIALYTYKKFFENPNENEGFDLIKIYNIWIHIYFYVLLVNVYSESSSKSSWASSGPPGAFFISM